MSYSKPALPLPLRINPKIGEGRPNLVIFMPDQLRYDSLKCTTPESAIRTPNIDAFCARGTLFTNCFTQASVCSQSRCSMFTGTYPHVSGHRSLENLIKPWEPNMFRSLKEQGYHVACLAPRGDTFAPTVTELSVTEYGFLETPEFVPKFAGGTDREKDESIFGRLFYRGLRDPDKAMDYDDAVVRSAITWLKCPPSDKPWVLFMPLLFPHCPFQVEEPYFSMYDRSSMGEPSSNIDLKTGYEPRYMKTIRERYGTGRATTEIWAEIKATYYGMISRLDDQFGRLVKAIEEHGYWDNTVTMFFTDHGEYLGDHGLIEKWPSGLSDSLVHEPLIIGGGGLPQGKVSDVMAEMVDLVPTVFELCGVGEHFPHNGKSLVPVLVEGATFHKTFAFSEGGFLTSEEPLLEQAPYPYDIKAGLQHDDTTLVGKAISIRNENWTYVYRLYEPAELYHRVNDPYELHNLAADPQYTAVARMLEGEIFRWLMEGSDFLPWTKDNRFPEVTLKSPREQMEERLKKAGQGKKANG
ncbi:alkaline-phosphatase-like protein [Halenospora varia]|nr:alkaline-phosphatase-like protein [Halenospora varia]